MKPSCPGLWFVVRFLITVSISVLVIGLFIFAISSWFSFGFGPASACRSPEGVCSSLRQDGVKGAADSGALGHSGQGVGRGTDAG